MSDIFQRFLGTRYNFLKGSRTNYKYILGDTIVNVARLANRW